MFGKISYTWSVMGESMRILRKDKEMLLFPLLSGIACLLVTASFAIPIFMGHGFQSETDQSSGNALYYVVGFLFYFCTYFIITFFNAALIACAVKRLRGGDPTFSEGISEALARVHLIFGWALLAATVGMILRIIQDRGGKLGQFIAGLLGFAWTLLSYLAVPVLVVENKGPFAALKESASLLRKTWGEQLIGNFSFGGLFFLINLPAIAALFIGFFLITAKATAALGVVVMAGGILYLLIASLVQTALQAIFQAAVYLFAADPQALEGGFEPQLVSQAISPKG
jgi:hypothetical protein